MRALDLFCAAGGATKGLQMAGFHVTGVDVKPQPRYCGDAFHQADALTFPLDSFDFIWASPPCQEFSQATLSQRMRGSEYPDLISHTRARLEASGIPYVIENVPGAPLRCDVMLCGSMFGLRLVRHRVFELSFAPTSLLPCCQHPPIPVSIAGHGTPSWARQKNGGKSFTLPERYDAMGIDWMDRDSLSLAIPPAYAEFIGRMAITSRISTPTCTYPR